MRRLMVFIFALFVALPAWADYQRLRVALHVDTAISHDTKTIKIAGVPVWKIHGDAPEPIDIIARKAKSEGIDAIIVADRSHADITFRLMDWSRLFTVTMSLGSVADIGGKAFLKTLDRTQSESGVIIVPGLEVVPHYEQTFDGLYPVFQNLHEHMVVAGLDTPKKTDALPDSTTFRGWDCSGGSLIFGVMMTSVVLSLLMKGITVARGKYKKLGIIMTVIPVLFLIDGVPFLPPKSASVRFENWVPVSEVAEYTGAAGGVSILAHPNTRSEEKFGLAREITLPYEQLISQSDCTAFAAFNDGMGALAPDKDWDTALEFFCRGQRSAPVWAVSESDYDTGSKPGALAEAQTMVYAKERTAAGVIDAIKNGRCYATRTDTYRKIDVAEYSLTDGAHTAISGETLSTHNQVTLNLRLKILSGTVAKAAERVRVQMIVNGVPTELPLTIHGDELVTRTELKTQQQNLSYVRVLVCDRIDPVIALNPIFIRCDGPHE